MGVVKPTALRRKWACPDLLTMTATSRRVLAEDSTTKESKVISEDGANPSVKFEEVSYITTGRRKVSKKARSADVEEPLVDTTATLPLRSKKTGRAQKRLLDRQKKASQRPIATTLLDLPPELVQEILGYLQPGDILGLLKVSRMVRDFVLDHENAVVRDVIRRRYWVLTRCFPLPVAFEDVDSSAHPSLLSEKRQDMISIHKKPYQHIKGIDPLKICTCMSCVFAWNNLCLILDLAHWQKNLNEREPIPMIERGTSPEWNKQLLDTNAAIVEKAMASRLCYARILEKHLQTTVETLFRTIRGKKTMHPRRLYHLTPADASKETDEFLERSGPPSYEFPWHRDNYYALEAYVPNRRWSKEQNRWLYYAETQHERDLQWVKEWFTRAPSHKEKEKPLAEFIESFKKQALA